MNQTYVNWRQRAATSEILGPSDAATIHPNWRSHYLRLKDLRRHLEEQDTELKEAAQRFETRTESEQADEATDSYDRDWALALLSADQNAVLEIDAAVERIHAGTYGRCELTGAIIPAARLAAVPWTRFTAEAEHELERQGEGERMKSKLSQRSRVRGSKADRHRRRASRR